MCTASWTRFEGGYELFFTRDERTTRGTALPPSVRVEAGVSFVAPTDRDAGGTWIAANEHGLTLSLLNGYIESGASTPGARSRGALVTELSAARSTAGVAERLAGTDLSDFLSFRLLAFEPEAQVRAFVWDGRALVVEDDTQAPIVSSSVDPLGAGAARRALYAELVGDTLPGVAELEAFHASHRPERGPLSVCMHREDASSVSLTRVRVERSAEVDAVRMTYSGGPPCEGRPAVVTVLPLAASAGSTSRT